MGIQGKSDIMEEKGVCNEMDVHEAIWKVFLSEDFEAFVW